MADLSRLSQLSGGIQRGIDLTDSQLLVDNLKIRMGSANAGRYAQFAGTLLGIRTITMPNADVDLSDIATNSTHRTTIAASQHNADQVDYERIDGSRINISAIATTPDVEGALSELDDAIGDRSSFTADTEYLLDNDTAAAALDKLDAQIKLNADALSAASSPMNFKGNLGAGTLADQLDDAALGDYYVVNIPGTIFGTNPIELAQGDCLISKTDVIGTPDNGIDWVKIDNTEASDILRTGDLATNQIYVGAAGLAAAVTMSGEATIAAGGALTLDNNSVTGKLLTGFVSGAATVAAGDSILLAINKLDGNTAANTSDLADLANSAAAQEAKGASLVGLTNDGATFSVIDEFTVDVRTALTNLDSVLNTVNTASHAALTLESTVGGPTQESASLTAQELTLNKATGATDGVMSSEDKTKLDDIGSASLTAEGLVELATVAEAAAGTDALRAVTPAGLAAMQTAISLNTGKVSADGSVATHSDVTLAGSGAIITVDERASIGTNETHVSSNGSSHSYIGNLQSLSGAAAGETTYAGDAFSGTTIANDSTIKSALQALETALELGSDNQTAVEVPYTPTDGDDWGTDPTEVKAALDQLATRTQTLEDDPAAVSSLVEDFVAGETMTASFPHVLRMAKGGEDAGRVYIADTDSTSSDDFHVVGMINTGISFSAGVLMAVTKAGPLGNFSGLTPGFPVYMDEGADAGISHTAPSTVDHAVVQLGVARTASSIEVRIQLIGVN